MRPAHVQHQRETRPHRHPEVRREDLSLTGQGRPRGVEGAVEAALSHRHHAPLGVIQHRGQRVERVGHGRVVEVLQGVGMNPQRDPASPRTRDAQGLRPPRG